MQPIQPKITQKLLLRSAIGIFALAGLILAFQWYKAHESDPRGDDKLDTAGWLAATESDASGDTIHAVVFKDDGTIVRQPNLAAATEDRDVVWRPDGNFVFFSSNREAEKFTMFRWFPDGGHAAELRSLMGLPQGSPFFLRADADKGNDAEALVRAGGRIDSYNARVPLLHQVLPPPDPKSRQEVDAEGGGRVSPFESMYQRFGTSFKYAKWNPGKTAVYAVMRRETGEILIYQKLNFATPQEGQPEAVVAGDKVDFDIDQKTGKVYYAVENFQWPDLGSVPAEFVKDGKVTVPYKHGIGVVDVSDPRSGGVIVASNKDSMCFGSITLAPMGDFLAVVAGTYSGNGNLTPAGLLVIPAAAGQRSLAPPVATGEVYEPSWSPDGKRIAFARRETPTSRPIYILDQGSEPRRISPDTGVFGNPVFSPQMKP